MKPHTANLARESVHTLYEQLAERLREHFVTHCDVGAQVPTEEDLTEMYMVSRSTVRRAIDTLVDEGLLVRRQGKGTFLARPMPKIVHAIDRIAPFRDAFEKAGQSVNTTIIDFSWVEHPELPALVSDWEKPVLAYSRRFATDGVTHAVTREYLPRHVGSRVSRSDVERLSTYDLLQKKLRISLSGAEFRVSSRPTSRGLGEILDISPNTFLLVLERVSYDDNGRAVEVATHFLRPDVYQLSVEVNEFKRGSQPHRETTKRRNR